MNVISLIFIGTDEFKYPATCALFQSNPVGNYSSSYIYIYTHTYVHKTRVMVAYHTASSILCVDEHLRLDR
jgi:hypothetical protein